MKPGLMPLILLLGVLFFSCKKELVTKESQAFATQAGVTATSRTLDLENGQLKIAVVSDIHYAAPDLFIHGGETGAAYQQYLMSDPKLLEFSDPIFRNVIANLKAERPDLILITGDMTKDGEKVSHQAVSTLLQSELSFAKIYVVPGNHDINNPEAVTYDGDMSTPTPSVSATEFETFYKSFGYDHTDLSIERDANSLSYLAKPYNNLWILAIDANKYNENTTIATVSGKIKDGTMDWIKTMMQTAKDQHATVLTMMHHNVVEHYQGQSWLDPGYTLDDWQLAANTLIEAGVNVVFTGHNHANDITPYSYNGNVLYDIETGSLVSPPSPYRIIMMKNKNLDITTNNVRTIDAALPGGMSFPAYSQLFITGHMDGYFNYMLTHMDLPVLPDLADFAAPIFRNAYIAYTAGDEKMPPDQRKLIDQLAGYSTDLAGMATTLWTDLGVKDNKTVITYRK